MERSEDGGITWFGPYTQSWLPIVIWGLVRDFPGNIYRAAEIGNDARYTGISPISNLLTIP